jgi:hypothetical protein
VLIAVLNDVMTNAWAQYQSAATELISGRLLWVVRQLQQMSRRVSTVHARVECSPAIAEWHNNFHLLTAGLFRFDWKAPAPPRQHWTQKS